VYSYRAPCPLFEAEEGGIIVREYRLPDVPTNVTHVQAKVEHWHIFLEDPKTGDPYEHPVHGLVAAAWAYNHPQEGWLVRIALGYCDAKCTKPWNGSICFSAVGFAPLYVGPSTPQDCYISRPTRCRLGSGQK
jgi:hypothetical protein